MIINRVVERRKYQTAVTPPPSPKKMEASTLSSPRRSSFQNHPPPITRILPFRKISHPPTLPTNRSSQVFLIDSNATVKLSSVNTIHVKQLHNVGFFIFKFTLTYMLHNVYINEIHARQFLYISLYHRESFSHAFNFFIVSKGILHV